MNWISIGKAAVTFVTSAGVSAVVGNVIKATSPAKMNTLNKIVVGIGGFVLSSMIADKASKYVIEELDSIMSSGKESLNIKPTEENLDILKDFRIKNVKV